MHTKSKYYITNRTGLSMLVTKYSVKSPVGTAIVQHGYPSSSQCIPVQAMVTAFLALNFNVVAPDTTHNDNASDGLYTDMTLRQHCHDLEDCVIATKASGNLAGSLILAGHSAGGYSALSIPNKLSVRPDFTLAVSPLISGQQYISGWQTMMEKRKKNRGETFIKRWQERGAIPYPSDTTSKKLSLNWSVMNDWQKHNLREEKLYPQNQTSIVIAGKDELTPRPETIDYANSREMSRLFVVPNADHGFSERGESLSQKVILATKIALNI